MNDTIRRVCFNYKFFSFQLTANKSLLMIRVGSVFIHKYFDIWHTNSWSIEIFEFLPIIQDLLTIFFIHQSHDGLFWITFELSYEMVVLYTVMENLNVGSFKYFINGMLEIFIPDIPQLFQYYFFDRIAPQNLSLFQELWLCVVSLQ